MKHVLLIEDDKNIARQICYYLSEEDCYQVDCAENVNDALRMAVDDYDVILLDVMLPDGNGIHLCEELRKIHNCPILFISCLSDSRTIINALDRGGDDYIVKPFDNGILHARIQANLRRVQIEKSQRLSGQLEAEGIRLDVQTHEVLMKGRRIALLPTEFRLLAFLMQHLGQCFSSAELYRNIWGSSSYGDNRTVVVHIYNIRKKIEDDPSSPKIVRSVWKKGYCFDPKGLIQEE